MGSARPDPFEQFVIKHGLLITSEAVVAYPRDVLATPADLDRHMVVTLRNPAGNAPPLVSLFVCGADDARPASNRDIMWWLSADSWALERADWELHRWAATYGYPDADPATLRLMRLHAGQAEALVVLLGRLAYEELLTTYERELVQSS